MRWCNTASRRWKPGPLSGSARLAEETPLEFAARLAEEHPPLAEGVQDLASLYAQIAYARRSPAGDDLGSVQKLWIALRRMAVPVA